MDSQFINEMFHGESIVKHYRAKVGDALTIQFPSVPLTYATQYLKLARTTEGDLNCFVEEATDSLEGMLFPTQILGRADCPGEIRIKLEAVDRLSDEKIPGVEPLEIVIRIEE